MSEAPFSYADAREFAKTVTFLMKQNGPQCLGTTREKYIALLNDGEKTAKLMDAIVERVKAREAGGVRP